MNPSPGDLPLNAESPDWSQLAREAAELHPGLPADADALREAVERVREQEPEPSFLGDLLLAELCVRGEADALRVFTELVDAVIPVALARSRVPRSWSDEVGQRLRTRLLVSEDGQPHLLRYVGRGPLRAWLKVAALRTGLDLLRKQGKEQTLEERVMDAAPTSSDPEMRFLRAHYTDQFKQALAASMAALPEQDLRLLKMRILDELNIDEIGALHGVHRATAARWLDSARDALGKGVRQHLERELAVKREDLDSILRLIRSRIDLSLDRRLGE